MMTTKAAPGRIGPCWVMLTFSAGSGTVWRRSMSSVVCRARLASFARAASLARLVVRFMLPDGTARRQQDWVVMSSTVAGSRSRLAKSGVTDRNADYIYISVQSGVQQGSTGAYMSVGSALAPTRETLSLMF